MFCVSHQCFGFSSNTRVKAEGKKHHGMVNTPLFFTGILHRRRDEHLKEVQTLRGGQLEQMRHGCHLAVCCWSRVQARKVEGLHG